MKERKVCVSGIISSGSITEAKRGPFKLILWFNYHGPFLTLLYSKETSD